MPSDNSLNKPGKLYFMGERDPITNEVTPWFKIGIVKDGGRGDNPDRSSEHRRDEHQTGNPRDLYVFEEVASPAINFLENKIHRLYAKLRIRGEWFRLSDDLLQEIIMKARQLAEELEELGDKISYDDDFSELPSNDEVLEPTEEVLRWHERWLEAEVVLKATAPIRARISEAIKAADKKGEDLSGVASVKQVERSAFNKDRLKAAYPDIYAQFEEDQPVLKGRFTWVKSGLEDRRLENIEPKLPPLLAIISAKLEAIETEGHGVQSLLEFQLELEPLEANAEWDQAIAERIIRKASGLSKGIHGVCKWDRRLDVKKAFNQAAFAAAYPDLKEEFTSKKAVAVVNQARANRQMPGDD